MASEFIWELTVRFCVETAWEFKGALLNASGSFVIQCEWPSFVRGIVKNTYANQRRAWALLNDATSSSRSCV